jgi:hypothetical protein
MSLAFALRVQHEAAEGRIAHNNVWNGANGMANHVFDEFDTSPLIQFQPLL